MSVFQRESEIKKDIGRQRDGEFMKIVHLDIDIYFVMLFAFYSRSADFVLVLYSQ